MRRLAVLFIFASLAFSGCCFETAKWDRRTCDKTEECPWWHECIDGYCQLMEEVDTAVDLLDSAEADWGEDIYEEETVRDFLPDEVEEISHEAAEDFEEDDVVELVDLMDLEDQPDEHPDEYEDDVCVPNPPERCNGLDDDCNGKVDDEIGIFPTTCGEGECVSSGVMACINGEWIDDCVPTGSPEICDGLDNDCDELVDEDFDMETDPENCGECGHVCRAEDEACIAGRCEPGDMIFIPAGTFIMGDESNVLASPSHEVAVPAFWIDQYEVTVLEYSDCVEANECSAPGMADGCNWQVAGRDEHPVNCVSWDDASAYCAWVGSRLCSEAEWEKATRGLDLRIYPWGNQTASCLLAIMNDGRGDGCGTGSSWAVGSKPAGASADLVYDLAGNVSEWVEDYWHAGYTNAPTDGSAWVEDCEVERRLSRGGAYSSTAGSLKSAYRIHRDPLALLPSQGFRCCR